MPESAKLRIPAMFNIYELYTRTRSRKTGEYKKLVKRIGREPNIIYPDGWYDWDIDRVIAGRGCVHHGMLEMKYIKHQIRKPFTFANYTRKLVKDALERDDMKIEYNTLHFSFDDRVGVYSGKDKYGVYPISRDKYHELLREKKEADKRNGNLGKGVFLFLLYTPKLEYFSVINFTGSKYILGLDPTPEKYQRWNGRVKYYLEKASRIIEPTFNELLLFMLEAYVRWDFYTLYYLLTHDSDNMRLEEEEFVLADRFEELVQEDSIDSMGEIIKLWRAFGDVMEWLLECVHFDTILEEAEEIKEIPEDLDEPSYLNLVDLTRNGEIFDYLAERINERYEYYERSRRAS